MEFRIGLEKESPYIGKLEGRKFAIITQTESEAMEFVIREVPLPWSVLRYRKAVKDGKCHVLFHAWQRAADGKWFFGICRNDFRFNRDGEVYQVIVCGATSPGMWGKGIDRVDWIRKRKISPSEIVEKIRKLMAGSDQVLLKTWLDKLM